MLSTVYCVSSARSIYNIADAELHKYSERHQFLGSYVGLASIWALGIAISYFPRPSRVSGPELNGSAPICRLFTAHHCLTSMYYKV